MRAVIIRSYGGPEVLEVAEVPAPEAGHGQVRIRMAAAAVNPADLAARSGALVAAGLTVEREQTGLGWDVAGTVDQVGPGVTGFAVGEAVIGLADRLDVPLAAQADLVVLDASAVARAPRGLSPAEAATLPLNGLTARQALDVLALDEGETLLVTGAAGAVGGYAVQLAVARGLRVVALAGDADEKTVLDFGAEWFVPRSAGRLGAAVRALVPGGVDGVLDAAVVGVAAHEALRGGGAFAALVAGAAPVALRGTRVDYSWIRADGNALAELAGLAEAGRLTTRVAGTLPLERVAAAHERLAAGGLRGRLVLVS